MIKYLTALRGEEPGTAVEMQKYSFLDLLFGLNPEGIR